jgi:SPP1 gp7 family putative phage head morphogenesis protein
VLGKSADAAVKSGLAPAWLNSMKQGFELAREVLGGGIDFTLYNPKFNAWVDKTGLLKAKEINDTTRTALREKLAAEVSEGVQSGESMSKIAGRISAATDGVYDNMSKSRAETIARTETMSSVNAGQFEVYKGEGATKKEWLSTSDDRTRDAHAAANGQVVGIDEPFDVGGEQIMYPGDPSGSAECVINCRCTVLPYLEEE